MKWLLIFAVVLVSTQAFAEETTDVIIVNDDGTVTSCICDNGLCTCS